MRVDAGTDVALQDHVRVVGEMPLVADEERRNDLRVVRREVRAAGVVDRRAGQIPRVVIAELLQCHLQAVIAASGRQQIAPAAHRHFRRGLEDDLPVLAEREAGVAQADRRVEQAAAGRRFEQRDLRILQVQDVAGAVADHGRAAEIAEAERVVEVLDRAVEKAAAVVHAAEHQVRTPLRGELVLERDVEQPQLEVGEIVLARQRTNRIQLGGPDLAPALQRAEVALDLRAQRPGVLIGELHLDAPAALGSAACVGRMSRRRKPKGVMSRARSRPKKSACRLRQRGRP